MIEAIAEMEKEKEELINEVDRIRVQIAERNLWAVQAKLAERIKNRQITQLTSGIATLRIQQRKKATKVKHEVNQNIQRDRHSRMVSEFFKIVDKDVFQSVVDRVDNDG
jgi:hypothetical protein